MTGPLRDINVTAGQPYIAWTATIGPARWVATIEEGPVRQAGTGTNYVNVPITNTDGVVLSISAPLIAFTATSVPPDPDNDIWYQSAWVTPIDVTRTCRILIGPKNSGTPIAPGSWILWVQIVDNPENPVIPAGRVTID